MNVFSTIPNNRSKGRSAFTLVEMLVAVGLTILMMSMFTVVFQLASGSISTQRGIATNDQRSRTMTTILQGDLKARTFISMVPFAPGENPPNSNDPNFDLLDFEKRKGYFYISENDPDDTTDDVLCFTMFVNPTQAPFFGRGKQLGIPETAPSWSINTPYTAGTWVTPPPGKETGLVYRAQNGGTSGDPGPPSWAGSAGGQTLDNGITWRAFDPVVNRNQPEWDDGQGGNETGSSRAAEVMYFMRGDKLYRRVMLIRQPLVPGDKTQPTDDSRTPAEEFFSAGYSPPHVGSFYRDFDYAARWDGTALEFFGVNGLDNGVGTGFAPLGKPRNRFGHDQRVGNPREYMNTGTRQNFFGRFTHEETSHNSFQYPKVPANPAARGSALADTNNDGVVDAYAGGERRGEDILMIGVHSFDVKIWDDTAQQFVDIGSTTAGDYHPNENLHLNKNNPMPQIDYGPSSPTITENRIFCTWHPRYDHSATPDDTDPANWDPPPYRPFRTVNINGAPVNVPRPVRAIQITVRYYDANSEQDRQVTIVESFVR